MTLVEVAIVVVMVGVIAVLAVLGYVRYRRRARMAEATNLVTGIRAEQEAFKTESGVYWQASTNETSFYPASTPGAFTTVWGGPCTNCVSPDAWKKLNIHPDAPVMYGYATTAGVGAGLIITRHVSSSSSSSSSGAPPSHGCTTIGPTDPYYVVQAQGDTDGDGVASRVLALSCSNALVITNEGE